ncbi:DASH complex subunit dam1 [Orbilia brochopaga]|uniref:DASH complex subunit DAM1 n=1 Tax=Orbilia brochopaga TaxID=3140254 RepID=A0AAV9UWS1_9PEZI
MATAAPASGSRPSSRGREIHRPTTPLRESSRSRDSVNRFRGSHEIITPIESITPFFAELEDAMNILHDNLQQLQQIHENINKFNENFSAMMYGMEMNAFCVDFPEAPIPESFKREEEAAREAERLAALQPPPRSEHEAETTFMTNDTFVEQPVTPASRNPKTPMRRGQTTGRGSSQGTSRGGGSTGRGGAGSSASSRGSRGGGSGRGIARARGSRYGTR